MALPTSSKTSTVLSKTTGKVIMKRSQSNVPISSEERREALLKKAKALDSKTASTAGTRPIAVPQIPAMSWAGKLTNNANSNNAINPIIMPRPTETPSGAPAAAVWSVPASNTEYQKLQRPGTSLAGTSAINRLQIAGRSALGSVAGNRLVQVAEPQGSFVASRDRASDRIHNPLDFQVGIVFSTATHQRDFAQEVDPRNVNQSMTHFGPVYSKFRKFIVIARFATHVLALPIFTHGGIGLARKAHKREFVSIRDVDCRTQAAKAESMHDVIWAERFPSFRHGLNWAMMSNTTSVQLTAPYSHPVGVKCTISGQLEPTSILYLLKLFGEVTISAVSAQRPVIKEMPDDEGFTTIRGTTSRAGSAYAMQGSSASIMRGRDSNRPSTMGNSYQPHR